MRARHAPFSSSAQLPVLLHASRQVVDSVPAADCLLCDWDSVLRQNNTAASPNETLVVTLDQFCRHLGSHMEQLALFALPRNYKDQGAEDRSNEAAAAAGSNASSFSSIRQRALSWRSMSSFVATQDLTVPDLAVDENFNPFEDVAYLNISKSSPFAWSRSYPLHKTIDGLGGFPTYWIKRWNGGAIGQTCFRQGEIYIHGGVVNGSRLEEHTYVIDMGGGKGILSTIDQGPGPRHYAAAVSFVSRNAFILFGGDARSAVYGPLNSALYWLDTSILSGFQWRLIC